MKQLEELFDRQKESLAQESEPMNIQSDDVFLLSFRIGDTRFASPIDRVREIVESAIVTPLPISHPTFLGVINLRGNLIPVLSPSKLSESAKSSLVSDPLESRFVIFETQNHEPFAVEATRVNKVLCPESELRERGDSFQEVIRIDGEPTHLLNFFGSEAQRMLGASGEGL